MMSGKDNGFLKSYPHGYFFLLLFIALILRIFLLPRCFINPDEGAHLMDAKLLLDGYRPLVDFESRLPLYTFILTGFVKIFGSDYLLIRWMPIFFTMLTAGLLYLLALEMYNRSCALLAAGIFLFSPLYLYYSMIVKTEPVAVFFTVAGFYCFIRSMSLPSHRHLPVFFAGVFSAMAYYIRASVLYLPILFLAIILLNRTLQKQQRGWLMLSYTGGYMLIVCSMMAVFTLWLPIDKILTCKINPLYSVVFHVLNILGKLPVSEQSITGTGIRFVQQNQAQLKSAWEVGILSNLFIFVSAFFIWTFPKFRRLQTLTIVSWAVIIVVLYLYQSLFHGFFSQYMTEILPPFILMAAFVLNKIFIFLTKKGALCLLLLYGLSVVIFKMSWFYSHPLYIYLIVISVCILFVLWWFFAEKRIHIPVMISFLLAGLLAGFSYHFLTYVSLRLFAMLMTLVIMYILLFFILGWYGRFKVIDHRQFQLLFLLILSIYVSAFYSGRSLGPQHVGYWSASAVKQVTALLDKQSSPNDVVLSGGMIWTFESKLTPYLNVTHPTLFLMKSMPDFQTTFSSKRPTFIIVDDYTQKKFALYWDFIASQLVFYKRIGQIADVRCTIEVYKLDPDRI
jgi:4-amino-4-deoxy-L-arabinose transferase-like glycosyltransferase